MLGTVKTTNMGMVGWGGEAMEEVVEVESSIRIKDVGLYEALKPLIEHNNPCCIIYSLYSSR
jgi:hypothetical protein